MSKSFDIKLTAMAYGGSALGRYDRQVIFVPYTIPGETVSVRMVEQKRSFAHAELLTIIDKSPDRIDAVCPYFGPGLCGGCHWQHIDYEAQLTYKQEVVIDQLKRLGKFKDAPVKPVVPSLSPWNYRVHATFTFTEDGLPAFYGDDGQILIPVDVCHIIHPALLDMLEIVELDAPGIDRVRLQVGSDPDDRMVVLHSADDVAPEVEVDLPVSVNFLLQDNEPVNLIGSTHVTYIIRERVFRVTAGGFFQANLSVAEVLVEQVLLRLNLQGHEIVLDLYSGVGLFTAFIAEQAEYVISVESYPPAVTDADQNLADMDNIDLVEGNVVDVLADLEGPIDGIVVDPPRNGLGEEVVDHLVRLGPERIVYVSCDPSTFARDARQLCDAGYRLLDVLPVDMFPQTYHIELIASFKL